MKTPEYYPYKSFQNIDPLEVGHTYMLVVDGTKVVSVSNECAVTSISVEDTTIKISLVRNYEITYWPGSEPLVSMGSHLTLRFEGARVTPNPVNEPQDNFLAISTVRDLTPFSLSDDDTSQGYRLGLEVNGWEDGRWDIVYREAWVDY